MLILEYLILFRVLTYNLVLLSFLMVWERFSPGDMYKMLSPDCFVFAIALYRFVDLPLVHFYSIGMLCSIPGLIVPCSVCRESMFGGIGWGSFCESSDFVVLFFLSGSKFSLFHSFPHSIPSCHRVLLLWFLIFFFFLPQSSASGSAMNHTCLFRCPVL